MEFAGPLMIIEFADDHHMNNHYHNNDDDDADDDDDDDQNINLMMISFLAQTLFDSPFLS